jgi:hypothetical protein
MPKSPSSAAPGLTDWPEISLGLETRGSQKKSVGRRLVMTRAVARLLGLIFVIAIVANGKALGAQQTPWIVCDERGLSLIADGLGDREAAVPELARIVAEPFKPIAIGVDSDELIASKLVDIQCRADAIDALGVIGEAAAPASAALIDWALMMRVIPPETLNRKDDKLFIDLITIDVLERMRVAGAVARFGPGSASAIAASLKSPDGERRKLAVAILNEKALPIAAALLKSGSCADRELGVAVLADMWPVAPRAHILDLREGLVCDARLTAK